jgi:hypothetical protein
VSLEINLEESKLILRVKNALGPAEPPEGLLRANQVRFDTKSGYRKITYARVDGGSRGVELSRMGYAVSERPSAAKTEEW